jgi:hypothetical protein
MLWIKNAGCHWRGQEDDYVLARPKKVNLGQHDQFLRSFQYREALSSALSTSDPTVCIVIPNEEECFVPGMIYHKGIGALDSFLLCR